MKDQDKIKAILDDSSTTLRQMWEAEGEAIEKARQGEIDAVDGFFLLAKNAEKAPKRMRIEVDFIYPNGDTYAPMETMESLLEWFEERLNTELSDGDRRLKMVKISVDSERCKITRE